MALTIKDVAKEAGVSIATVSRVLNRKDKVKDSTRRKIEYAIKKLNFQPDPIARTMIVKETKMIGLCIPTLTNEYWALLTETVQVELSKQGYILLLFSFGDACQHQEEMYLRTLLRRRVDGIIWGTFGAFEPENSELFHEIINKGIPMVALDMKIPGIHRVSGDHTGGAQEAVGHLLNLGHDEIAYIGVHKPLCEREQGYRNAHVLHGIPVNEKLIKRTDFGIEPGYQATRELLQTREKFTAIFCWNDLLAAGAIRALQEAGICVPDEMSVVGYDDITLSSLLKPALTTVKQPVQEIGKALVQTLLESIEQRGKKQVSRNVTLQMQLIIRESCGALRKG